MTSISKPIVSTALCLLGAIAIYMAVNWIGHLGVAYGATAASAGDQAKVVADGGWDVVASYGPLWGAFLLAATLLSTFVSRQHWLQQGRTLALITAASMTAAAVIDWHFNGAQFSGVIVTAVMALKLVWSPTASPAPSAATKAASVASAVLVLGLGVLAAQPACDGRGGAIAQALWDCTAPQRRAAVDAVTPAVISVIKAAGSADGKAIDMSTIKSAITKANLLTEAGLLLSCATANAFAILQAPAPVVPGQSAASPFVLDPAVVRATWARLDAEQFGGARFATDHGAM